MSPFFISSLNYHSWKERSVFYKKTSPNSISGAQGCFRMLSNSLILTMDAMRGRLVYIFAMECQEKKKECGYDYL